MNYFIYNFTLFHCTGRYELNKLTSLPMCGFIAQLVEHRTGIAEVTGSNPVEALIFSGFFFPIGPLHDPVTWYGINYTGTQITQWDFQNKGTRTSPARLSFVLKVPLRNLRPSVIYSVPCDRIVQRAYRLNWKIYCDDHPSFKFLLYLNSQKRLGYKENITN